MTTNRLFTCCIPILTLTLGACGAIPRATLPSSLVIEDYDKSELKLVVSPFGDANPINVGEVSADGQIQFDWPEVNADKIEGSEFHMGSIARAVGMNFCNDKEIKRNDEVAKAVAIQNISLVKYGKPVGALSPATQKELNDNAGSNRSSSLVLGSSIFWLYSDSDAVFEAKCVINMENEGNYSFKEVTNYNLELKRGWNVVQHSLVEKQDWESEGSRGSLPKTITKTSVIEIPGSINWYMNYWANDELLDIEHKLLTQTPVTRQAFESWVPTKLGELNRTSYAINEQLATIANENNLHVVFSGGDKDIDLTIADSAGSKDTVGVFTMTLDMTGTQWKDEVETGYRSSALMRGTPVLIEFNSKTKHTAMTYNANDRFIVKALAENMDPETLWGYLEGLQLDQLE